MIDSRRKEIKVLIAADVIGPTVSREIFMNRNEPPHIIPRRRIINQFKKPGFVGEMIVVLFKNVTYF